MDLDLLKEKQKNESKKIDNKFEESDNKTDELYNKIEEFNNKIDELSEKIYLLSEEIQQRFQEEDTLTNYSRNLSSNNSSSSSRASRQTLFSDPLAQNFKNLFDKTMRKNDHTKSDMINEIISDLKKETKIKVIGAKAIENFYNGTTKSDHRTTGAIKTWIALKSKNKFISSSGGGGGNINDNEDNNTNEIINDDK